MNSSKDDPIKAEVDKVKKREESYNATISDDRAFSCVLLQYIFNVDAADQGDMITDAPNDGGIDFVYYDEDESKVVLGQAKYRPKLSNDEIIHELMKIKQPPAKAGGVNGRLKVALRLKPVFLRLKVNSG